MFHIWISCGSLQPFSTYFNCVGKWPKTPHFISSHSFSVDFHANSDLYHVSYNKHAGALARSAVICHSHLLALPPPWTACTEWPATGNWQSWYLTCMFDHCCDFVSGKTWIHFDFLRFLNTEMIPAPPILPGWKQETMNPVKLVPWLLMTQEAGTSTAMVLIKSTREITVSAP